ncbi:MAG TPA: hypothetical protein VHM88_19455, partial [Candidatus Acidoferrales bacterium]|nr:hypothetical protein [Candidatus Acidoferrales bacterium]
AVYQQRHDLPGTYISNNSAHVLPPWRKAIVFPYPQKRGSRVPLTYLLQSTYERLFAPEQNLNWGAFREENVFAFLACGFPAAAQEAARVHSAASGLE